MTGGKGTASSAFRQPTTFSVVYGGAFPGQSVSVTSTTASTTILQTEDPGYMPQWPGERVPPQGMIEEGHRRLSLLLC